MIYHAPAHIAIGQLEDNSIDVVFTDPPYNTKKSESRLPEYDKSESIIQQKWVDFNASWDSNDNLWEFTEQWLAALRPKMKDTGSLFICGSHHNIPVTDLVLKKLGYYVIEWIAWCIPNAFPNRELQKMTSANQILIWARKSKSPRHFYNAGRARDYMALDCTRLTGYPPKEPTNLRDFWFIGDETFWIVNNDSRAVKQFPWLIHGAKKPPELVGRALDIALPDAPDLLVVDPFAGTNTTGYVCKYINDWVVTPRKHQVSSITSDLYVEYVRMGELRLELESISLPGGLSLPEDDREDIRKRTGEWAKYILDGEELANKAFSLIQAWDSPRPKLKIPPAFHKQKPVF